MARYFAGTRALWACRAPGAFEWQTTVGSPARFDNSATTGVSGAVGVSGTGEFFPDVAAFLQVPLIMDATSTSGVLWGHFEFLATVANRAISLNITRFVSWVNSSGVTTAELVSAGTNSRNFYFRYWNGTNFIQSGAIFSVSTTARAKYDFRLTHGVSGGFDLWINGALVASVSGLAAAVDDTKFVRLHAATNSPLYSYYSQVGLADFAMHDYSFPEDILSGFGTYNAGTGTVASQSDVDLATVYTLAANGDKVTGTTAARTLPSGAAIRAVQINGLETATAPIANSKKMLRIGGTDYFSSNVSPAPTGVIEPRAAYWDTDPSTSAAWGITNYNSSEKGHQAVT